MKISTSQINEKELTKFGFQVTELIKEHKYKEIENHFGYALSFSESPADVIKNEITSCLSQAGNAAKLSTNSKQNVVVKFFEENNITLIAVVECALVIENGVGEMLVELIVAGTDTETHLSLEQISYQA
ncbi:MAG: hypothetical protein JRC87_12095 [Deltaproteobacteria bacterium]|nr:hypothetical protein [Deltaproteobacteria bacterium]